MPSATITIEPLLTPCACKNVPTSPEAPAYLTTLEGNRNSVMLACGTAYSFAHSAGNLVIALSVERGQGASPARQNVQAGSLSNRILDDRPPPVRSWPPVGNC